MRPIDLDLGLSHERAAGAVRFSLGRGTTAEDLEDAVRLIAAAPLAPGRRPEGALT